METRIIDGVPATDQAGAAEVLGRSQQTIKVLAGSSAKNGFPRPLPGTGRGRARAWYALTELHAFRVRHLAAIAPTTRPLSDGVRLGVPDDEMLGGPQFARALRVQYPTFNKYVSMSVPGWEAHRALQAGYLTVTADRVTFAPPLAEKARKLITTLLARYGGESEPGGVRLPGGSEAAITAIRTGAAAYLPLPDAEEAARRGTKRLWRARAVQDFIDHRGGTTAGSGRRPQPKTGTISDEPSGVSATPGGLVGG